MKMRIDVTLKEGVLDPQGKAIGHALGTLGFEGVEDVRVGRVFFLETHEKDPAKAIEQAKAMAEKLLANPVIETFAIQAL